MMVGKWTNTHPFNGPFSGTTQVSRYQKGKTNLDFTEARESEWQWHQLGHMQVCTLLQTDNHANTSPLSFFTGRMPFLPPNQQRQSTEGKWTKHNINSVFFRYCVNAAITFVEFILISAVCRKHSSSSACFDVIIVAHLQLLTVWHEYSAVHAYKHMQMSQQITEAQLQLNRGT